MGVGLAPAASRRITALAYLLRMANQGISFQSFAEILEVEAESHPPPQAPWERLSLI